MLARSSCVVNRRWGLGPTNSAKGLGSKCVVELCSGEGEKADGIAVSVEAGRVYVCDEGEAVSRTVVFV